MFGAIVNNLRDLPHATTASVVLSGLLVIVIGYSSSLVIVFQAASAANLTPGQTSSWVLAVTVGTGITSIIMSLWFRQPVAAAWSTAGAALLVNNLSHYAYGEAIGAYIVCGVAVTVLGFSGMFGRLMSLVPTPIVLGMLGGILLRFGIGTFNAIPTAPLIVIPMLIAFFVLRRIKFRAPTVIALILGVVLAALTNEIHSEGFSLALATPEWTPPIFTLQATLGLALPLFALAVTTQDAPAQAVLRAEGYDAPIDKGLILTGIASVISAPFGGHGITLAAITAALVAGKEAHHDPDLRYAAGVSAGFWNTATGIFGTAIVALFAGLPAALIAATSGLGLFNAISSAISGAMAHSDGRDGALAALLCTAANFNLLGIGAPFWGLIVGLAVHWIMTARRAA